MLDKLKLRIVSVIGVVLFTHAVQLNPKLGESTLRFTTSAVKWWQWPRYMYQVLSQLLGGYPTDQAMHQVGGKERNERFELSKSLEGVKFAQCGVKRREETLAKFVLADPKRRRTFESDPTGSDTKMQLDSVVNLQAGMSLKRGNYFQSAWLISRDGHAR